MDRDATITLSIAAPEIPGLAERMETILAEMIGGVLPGDRAKHGAVRLRARDECVALEVDLPFTHLVGTVSALADSLRTLMAAACPHDARADLLHPTTGVAELAHLPRAAQQMAHMGIRPIVIHGSGAQVIINEHVYHLAEGAGPQVGAPSGLGSAVQVETSAGEKGSDRSLREAQRGMMATPRERRRSVGGVRSSTSASSRGLSKVQGDADGAV